MLTFTIRVHDGLGDKMYAIKIDENGDAWKLLKDNDETCEEDLEKLFWTLHDILGKDLHG